MTRLSTALALFGGLTLFSASAALAAPCGNTSAGFGAWKAAFASEARQAGVGQKGLQALAATRYASRTIAADRNQKSFRYSLEKFMQVRGSATIVSQGRALKTRNARFRNGAGLCQGFRASQKSRRRSHSSPSFKAQIQKLAFSFSLHPHVRTEGHPLPGLRSSVRSQPHGCHSMPGPNLVLGAHLLRVFSVSR